MQLLAVLATILFRFGPFVLGAWLMSKLIG